MFVSIPFNLDLSTHQTEKILGALILLFLAKRLALKKDKEPPIAGVEFPIIGNLAFLKYLEKRHTFGTKYHYLLGPIFKCNSIAREQIYISNHEIARKILYDDINYDKPGFLDEVALVLELLTKGIFENSFLCMDTNDTWKFHRRLLNPAFGPAYLKLTADASLRNVKMMMDVWNTRLEAKLSIPIEIWYDMNSLILDITGEYLFGKRFGAIHDAKVGKIGLFSTFDKRLNSMVILRTLAPSWSWNLLGIGRKYSVATKIRKELSDYIYGAVAASEGSDATVFDRLQSIEKNEQYILY